MDLASNCNNNHILITGDLYDDQLVNHPTKLGEILETYDLAQLINETHRITELFFLH
jgi:hypothetical protein